MKIYAIYDKVAERFISTTISETDGMFLRQALFAILMDYAVKDIDIYCVGEFDTDFGYIKPVVPRQVPLSAYKFPETRESKDKYLTIEQIEQAAKKKREELTKQKVENVETLKKEKVRLNSLLSLEEEKDKKDKKKIKALRAYINQVDEEINRLGE